MNADRGTLEELTFDVNGTKTVVLAGALPLDNDATFLELNEMDRRFTTRARENPRTARYALALLGAAFIVVNGVPGLTVALAPNWRGDLLLLLSGVCFAAYDTTRRHQAQERLLLLNEAGKRIGSTLDLAHVEG